MKILLINKFFHSQNKAGGVGRNILTLKRELEKRGHKVVPFACKTKNHASTSYSKYFPDYQDLDKLISKKRNYRQKLKALKNIFYNREARKNLAQLLEQENIDLAHIHNIYHHLSPALIYELSKREIPIIQTVHDYNLISPNYNLFANGEPHESCAGLGAFRAPIHRCIKNSFPASLISALRIYYLYLSRVYKKNINQFIAPSKFIAQKHIQYDYPEEKITQIYNPFPKLKAEPRFEPGDYFLYSGRLSPEKGVEKLILAMGEAPEEKLIICGSGPQEEKLKRLKDKKDISNVEFKGFKKQNPLYQIIKKAKAVVVPSLWYENNPYAIIEAYAFGKPVLSSKRGGLEEIVHPKETGFHFNPESKKDLVNTIKKAANNKELLSKLGKGGYEFFKDNFTLKKILPQITEIYRKST